MNTPLAQIYFLGFDNSTIAGHAFSPLRGNRPGGLAAIGLLAAMSLADLSLFRRADCYGRRYRLVTSSAINLATATSFSDAATKITAGLPASAADLHLECGQLHFILTSSTTGASSTITYATGTLSAGLMLTAATGAILSQGDTADTPATAMDNVKSKTQNWVDFMTMWEPDITGKEDLRFGRMPKISDMPISFGIRTARPSWNGSTTCFGAAACPWFTTASCRSYNTKELAAFTLGTVASIDFFPHQWAHYRGFQIAKRLCAYCDRPADCRKPAGERV